MRLINRIFFTIMLLGNAVALGEIVELKTISQDGLRAKYNQTNLQKPGICIEIMQAIENIDPGIKFVGLEAKASTTRIEASLEHGEIDVFFGFVNTAERTAKFTMAGPPLYASLQALVVRSEDPIVVNNLADLRQLGNDGIILVNRGSAYSQYLKSFGGLTLDDQSIHVTANLLKLMSGRGRFYYISPMYVKEEIEALGLASKVRILPQRYERETSYAFFSRKTPKIFVNRVAANLRKLEKSGELKKIRSRYAAD